MKTNTRNPENKMITPYQSKEFIDQNIKKGKLIIYYYGIEKREENNLAYSIEMVISRSDTFLNIWYTTVVSVSKGIVTFKIGQQSTYDTKDFQTSVLLI